MRQVLAFIPARAGSRRIPNKNFKEFCGYPIITFPLRALNECNDISQVIVSSDSPEVAKILLDYPNVDLFERSKDFSGDNASTIDAVREYLYTEKFKEDDLLLCIYPCTPMLTAKLITKLIELYRPQSSTFALTGLRVDQRMGRLLAMDNEGISTLLLPKLSRAKTQELPVLFQDAGQMYIGTVENWLKANEILSSRVQVLEVDASEFIDIDSLEDWELAEKVYLDKGI
jgi:CMP-N-acetylneuraminic acid synthetase